MKSDHARFDSLAGAIVLGEASAQDREQFAAHAAGCATCRQHGAPELAGMRERIQVARDSETWRPSLGSTLMTRIRDERLQRSRATLRLLSWSVALSIALDAAFVSGVTTYAGHVLHATGTSMANVVASYRTGLR